MRPFLFGLDHASHDFTDAASLGKNIFTNAFPLAMAQYLSVERNLEIPTIQAEQFDGRLTTKHQLNPWRKIIGTDPENAFFMFEGVYDGYNRYTHSTANKSDVVVKQRKTGEHLRPLEIKLVVVPTSSTARKTKGEQTCELVVRPPTVEQLSFSIAHSYGPNRRHELQNMIANSLGQPNDYSWTDERSMIDALPRVLNAAETIALGALDAQTPLVLTAVWRSEGQKPVLEQNAFDVFAWTDMAFMQLFINATWRAYYEAPGQRKRKLPKEISRPSRALIWLIRSLWDYTTQGSLDFGRHHSQITYGVQSDKAASFTGTATLEHLRSEQFLTPRISRDELERVLTPAALEHLMPERRLDAAIAVQHLANQQSLHTDAHIRQHGPIDIKPGEPSFKVRGVDFGSDESLEETATSKTE